MPFERFFKARAKAGDNLRCGVGAETSRVNGSIAVGQPEERATCEEIAGSRGIHGFYLYAGDHMALAVGIY